MLGFEVWAWAECLGSRRVLEGFSSPYIFVLRFSMFRQSVESVERQSPKLWIRNVFLLVVTARTSPKPESLLESMHKARICSRSPKPQNPYENTESMQEEDLDIQTQNARILTIKAPKYCITIR